VRFDATETGHNRVDHALRPLRGKWGTVNAEFTGTFHAWGDTAHMGAYESEMIVHSVNNVKLVDHLGLPPKTLTADSRTKVCQ